MGSVVEAPPTLLDLTDGPLIATVILEAIAAFSSSVTTYRHYERFLVLEYPPPSASDEQADERNAWLEVFVNHYRSQLSNDLDLGISQRRLTFHIAICCLFSPNQSFP